MSCPLSRFSDIFGKPNEGAHSYRFLDIAIVDVTATIIGAGMLSGISKYLFETNFIKYFIIFLIILFILAIGLHRLFCVNTTINKFIFGEIIPNSS